MPLELRGTQGDGWWLMATTHVWRSIFGPAMAVVSPGQIDLFLVPPAWTRVEGERMAAELKEEFSRELPALEFDGASTYVNLQEESHVTAIHWQGVGKVEVGEDEDKLSIVLPSPVI